MGGYIIADLVRPDLSIVNIVIFIGEMDVDDVVDFFLDEGTDVIEDCFFLFGHGVAKSIIISGWNYAGCNNR